MATRYRYRTNEACSYLAQHASANNLQRDITVRDLRELQEHTENGQKRNRFNKEMENLLKTIISHGKNMKTSFMYIKNERRKLLARLSSPVMSEPVWFLTLSSADLYWPELWKAIYPEKSMAECKSLPYEERQKALRDNPILACRMFRYRIDNILKYILKGDSHPVGYLVDWWFRVEFQNRGSLHVHAILWTLLFYELDEKSWWNGEDMCNLVAGMIPPTDNLRNEFQKLNNNTDADVVSNSNTHDVTGEVNDVCPCLDTNECKCIENELEEKCFCNPSESISDLKSYTRNCRKLAAKIIDPYISGCVPTMDNLKPNEQSILKPIQIDSLEHGSLAEFDYVDCLENECMELQKILASTNFHSEFHRKSCFKGGRKHCRAHFPRGLRDKTEIKFVKLKGSNVPTLRAMPKRNHIWVNDYNGWVILHHRGNMDIQFISNPYGTATYCCMYSSKSEAPDSTILTNNILNMLAKEDAAGVHEITRKKLYLASVVIFSSREISMQEIGWYLLGYPFVFATRTVVDINLLPPSMRNRRLKTAAELAILPEVSTNIYRETADYPTELINFMHASLAVDTLRTTDPQNNTVTSVIPVPLEDLNRTYENVPDMTLYDFLTWYTVYNGHNFPQHFQIKSQESDFKFVEVTSENRVFYYIKRKKARVVSTCPYIPPNKNDMAGAWAILILHHRHFKNLNEIFLRENTSSVPFENMAVARLKDILETSGDILGTSYSEVEAKQTRLQDVMKNMKRYNKIKNRDHEYSDSDSDTNEEEIYDDCHHDVLYDECEDDGNNHIDEYTGNLEAPSVFGIHAVTFEIYMRAKRFVETTKNKAD
jgi:hypothetical protein